MGQKLFLLCCFPGGTLGEANSEQPWDALDTHANKQASVPLVGSKSEAGSWYSALFLTCARPTQVKYSTHTHSSANNNEFIYHVNSYYKALDQSHESTDSRHALWNLTIIEENNKQTEQSGHFGISVEAFN